MAQQFPDHITSSITYNNDTGKRYHIEIPSEKSAGKFVMATNQIKTKVLNARNTGCMLSSHGFQLIPQKTALTTSDFYNNPEDIIRTTYYKEMEETIKSITGASFVKAMHHVVRNGNGAPKGVKGAVDAPAYAAHCDYTPFSGFKSYNQFKLLCPKDDGLDYSKGRVALMNVWRNISDEEVIHTDHLAVCDGRSVVAPDDYLKYDYISPEGYKSESFYLNSDRQPFHKWYYYPGMQKNEALVFMQFDSDWQNQSRHTFHTAIQDPAADSKTPPRESIEVRLVAFFPKHQPNTIPKQPEKPKGKLLVQAAVKGLFDAVSKYANMWPKKAKKHMARNLRVNEIRAVIKEMVEGSAKAGYHELGESSAEDQEMVIAAMMERAEEWKKIALENFPENENDDDDEEETKESESNNAASGGSMFVDVDTAVQGVRKSVQPEILKYWPDDAKKGIATMLREKEFREVLGTIVKGGVDGGHNNLGGATTKQAEDVVNALMEDGDALKEEMMKNFPQSS